MRKQPKVFVANTAFYANNKGVEASTKASIYIIRDCFSNAEIVIWQTPPEGTDIVTPYVERHGDILLYKEKSILFFLIRATFYILSLLIISLLKLKPKKGILYDLTSSDFIINLNYGDLFTNVYYGNRIWYLIVLSNIMLVMSKKPLILFPQSIGPFRGKFSRFMARSLLHNSAVIMVREKHSRDILERILKIKRNKILSTPDVTLMLKSASKERIDHILETENVPKDVQRPLIGLILNPFLQRSQIEKKVLKTIMNITRFVENNLDGTVMLIPHSASQNKSYDGGSYNLLVKNLLIENGHQRVLSVNSRYSAEELKGLIGQCDLLITFPTHPAIAAFSLGVPAIALTYSHKTIGIYEEFGVKKYATMFSESTRAYLNGRIIESMEELMKKRKLIQNELLKECSEREKIVLVNTQNACKAIFSELVRTRS